MKKKQINFDNNNDGQDLALSKQGNDKYSSNKQLKLLGNNPEESQEIWGNLLKEVSNREGTKDTYLLLLGDRGCGKRSLIRQTNAKHVQGQSKNKHIAVDEMGSDFAALDYSFLYVKDLSEKDSQSQEVLPEDNLPKLNIYSLQDSSKTELLEAVLKSNYFDNMVATIMLDLDQPWELMN